jgi:hypothetical protein
MLFSALVVFINNFNEILPGRVQFAKLNLLNNWSYYDGKAVILMRDGLSVYLDLALG